MKAVVALAVAVSCLVASEAEAQCATSCSTVTPKHPVVLRTARAARS